MLIAPSLLLAGCAQPTPFTPTLVDCVDLPPPPEAELITLKRGSEGYPPPTHWPEPYGTEIPPPEPYPVWGRYSYATTDPRQVSLEDAEAFADALRQATGAPTRILSHPSQLHTGSKANQVLSNLQFGHSLVTVVIGPGWDPSTDEPILLFSGNPGTSSNNGSVLGLGWASQLVGYPGLAAEEGLSAVVMFSNAGGAESQGQHPDVIDDVACAIAWAGANLGADTDRVVFTGKSRGGGTALLWGANPHAHDYGVAGVFAHTPPWNHRHLIESPPELFPEIIFLAAELAGLPESPYWSAEPTPLDLRERFFEIHGPDGTPQSVAAHTIRAHREGLRDVERLSVGLGTHDQQVLYSDGVGLLQDFEDMGLSAHLEIGVRAGHIDQPGVWEQLDAALLDLTGHTASTFDPSPTRVLHAPVGDEAPNETLTAGAVPWVGLVPVLVETGATSSVLVCGPGGRLEVSGGAVFDRTVEEGCTRIDFTGPSEEGVIDWSFTVQGTPVAASERLHDAPLQTQVTSEQLGMEAYIPDTSDSRVAGFARL
ncbi:MAG: hypothetical protein KTR31_18945 [Myxococcales bacterium]|nr:hypothetical protein [Myxococcales bacterium]